MRLFVAGLIICGLSLPATAGETATAEPGQKLAQTLCANCHDVSGRPRAASPPGGAPTFFDVAQSTETNADKLRRFLRLPHGKMTNVLLTERNTDDVVRYILSLRKT